jgi:hypothetical protein
MAAFTAMNESELRKAITQIHLNPDLTEQEKAKKRQELLSGQWAKPAAKEEPASSTGMSGKNDLECIDEKHGLENLLVRHRKPDCSTCSIDVPTFYGPWVLTSRNSI